MKLKNIRARVKKICISICVLTVVLGLSDVIAVAAPVNFSFEATIEFVPIFSVAQNPTISHQPTDITVVSGNAATLNVTASVSNGTLSYQWYSNSDRTTRGGTAISGATRASYSAPTVTVGTKYYYCVITNTETGLVLNSTASATSNVVSVTVVAPAHAQTPTITRQPVDIKVNMGDAATLNVNAQVSKGNLSYQWYLSNSKTNSNGSPITGATNSTYSPPTSKVGTAYYYCVVTNTDNSATGNKTASVHSNAISVMILQPTVIGGQWDLNLTWTLNLETGLLEIKGTGDMRTWWSQEDLQNVPWREHQASIKSVQLYSNESAIAAFSF